MKRNGSTKSTFVLMSLSSNTSEALNFNPFIAVVFFVRIKSIKLLFNQFISNEITLLNRCKLNYKIIHFNCHRRSWFFIHVFLSNAYKKKTYQHKLLYKNVNSHFSWPFSIKLMQLFFSNPLHLPSRSRNFQRLIKVL